MATPIPARTRRGRLAVRIYVYTLSCVVLAVAVFVFLAVWTRPDDPPPGLSRFGHPPWPPELGEPGHQVHVAPPPWIDDGPHHVRVPPGVGPIDPPSPRIPTRLFVLTGLALLGVGLVTSIVFARSLVQPLQRLEATADAFGRGDHQARTGLDRSDEIGAVARAFDQMAERTTQLVRSERELMANVSHELRTPLARMRVALDLAAEGDAETAREVSTEIDRDVTELVTLVDAVLTSMRMDLAAAPLRRAPTAPAEIARRAAARSAALDVAHRVEVEVTGAPGELDVDPDLIRRAIDNLIDNARKYSDPSSPIALRVAPTASGAAFEIEDHGIGIAPDELDRIFTPFFRADRSRDRDTGGVGLGLSLARKIVEAHGGTITVRSALGRGTTFRVELPAGASATT